MKPVLKTILHLALPAMAGQFCIILMEILDASMVGQLGASASAAVGAVASSTWMLNGLTNGAVFGFSVQASRAVGAKQREKSAGLARLGLASVFVWAVCAGAVGYGFAPALCRFLGLDAQVSAGAQAYLRIFCLGLPFAALNAYAFQMLVAAGKSKLCGIVQAAACALDAGLNYIFLFQLGWGTAGASLATQLALAAGGAVLLFGMFQNEWYTRKAGTQLSWISTAFRIGIPAALEQVFMSLASILFTAMAASVSTAALAANALAITAESVTYMPVFGLSYAASALVGQYEGAGKSTRQLDRALLATGAVYMSFAGLFLFFGSHLLMSLLSPDVQVVQIGSTLLKIEAFAEIMYGTSIIAGGILRGRGQTMLNMVLMFVSLWAVRLPLGWLLMKQIGIYGLWAAMMIELNVRGLLYLIPVIRRRKRYECI